ncbi:phospholipase D-like domain-containing protein [Burkholderia sp. 22PA0106]|uniref:phospholipase D-like domain-containing protein n=1 Tax=Burkholderia sp. 22PA0106 TaxID=3237371 RepID=UPI0039C326FC
MADPSKIVVPIARNETSSATLCLPWFLDMVPADLGGSDKKSGGFAEFHPVPASYQPLVNGEETFGALYDAILAARHSIDYLCWGFQPSMYFRRRGGDSLCIGDLLIRKGREGVKVRILCWADTFAVAQKLENPNPGYDLVRSAFTQNENNTQLEYDREWYYRARIAPSPEQQELSETLRLSVPPDASGVGSTPGLSIRPLENIQLVTRDFSLRDRWEIMYRESRFRSDTNVSEAGVMVGYGGGPSHHQKMVLIDYEVPSQAVGFVMGHNTLDAYWDDDAHRYARMHPRFGRNGETPRQDMSALVTGPILEHLNVNFCRAWQRSAKVDLLSRRKTYAAQLKVRPGMGTPVMAQINRTQSQEGVRNIKALYLQAVNNATQFIYIENQYFRWAPLAEKIKAVAQQHVLAGRDPGKHGPLYLFVVTNSTDDAVGMGTGTTYDMLDSLGRADTMPNVARVSRSEQLGRDFQSAMNEAVAARLDHGADGGARREAARKKLDALRQQFRDNRDVDKPILPQEIPGLKIHVCTLVAPDSPAKQWMPVYVHSKIMIVDDVFLTHGSANINLRSMEVDSELNICHEHSGVTQALRRRLWGMHTGGRGAQDLPGDAFEEWGRVIDRNADTQAKNDAPKASLVGFMRTSTSRLRLD